MTAAPHRITELPDAELLEFLRTAPAGEVGTTVSECSEKDLARLVAATPFREHGVRTLLDRFADFVDDGRLAELDGVVCFELTYARKDVAPYRVRFHAGAVMLDPDGPPDVTIGLDTTEFLRLFTGASNAALLYLGGRLSVEGDDLLALDVGSVFTVPGSDRAAIDPTALDPVDVATAVATTSSKHMRSVMAGGFRPIVLTEVFRRFPDFIDAEKAADLRLSVGFRIGGRPDGEVDRYVVHVADGACTVETGPGEEQHRDATISIDGADFLRLATGQLHPVRGVITGAMKVKGDRGKALTFNKVMVPPQPRS